MADVETLRHAAALAHAAERPAAARALAEHLGGEALVVLVGDPEIHAFVPAPGFPQTVPGGRGWRELLRRCYSPGVHAGKVGYPGADTIVPAMAYAGSNAVMVVIGGKCDRARLESVGALLPLLSSMLRAEQGAVVAAGHLAVARQDAQRNEALARALDAARADAERAFAELEGQTKSLLDARARAEEATRAKDEFLAMLGHELRNPLSPIVTALQVLRLKGQICPEHEIIERQVAHQIRLVDDLLDVSRITQGKIELRRERVEIADVAQRAIEMASPLLEQKRQVLSVHVPTGLFVDADAARLAQVLANLLTNAAKYSDAGTIVELRAQAADRVVKISVRDEGIGVDPQMLDHIFDRFVQQRQGADRAEGGLGLGLAIVRSLVQLHGGSVHVESEGVGHGSEFVIELPAAARDTPVDLVLAASAEEPVSAPTESARVLVVDDNADGAELLADALGMLGYEVRTAGDGPSALRIATQFRPVIGLLDIGLPVMDGYELGVRLKQLPELESLRLVAITGYGQDTDRQRSRDAGFDAHLVKPIDLSILQQILQGLRANEVRRA